MPTFSQRYGYTSTEKAFQKEAVDSALRTKLWNVLKISIWDKYNHDMLNHDEHSQRILQLAQRLWFHYFNRDMDQLPRFNGRNREAGFYEVLKDYFANCEWYEVYNLMEEISQDQSKLLTSKMRDWINATLEEYNSAYRFVGTEIAEITDENEIGAIESALTSSDSLPRTHLATALHLLSNREAPDYRNSVKESISAVEAACRLVTGNASATLGDALKGVQNLHPAMSQAFSRLYGYSSDASGIRHSLTEEATITYADAKFMLVACSPFVSYLKVATNT